ncbi:hypothetical protein BECAL_02882 [Bellilinea caldifistulae]|uniref:Uncharacterized protein n=1 Tax=Bellilinea caldifistulae TaxID=360411 RepID=A0A0N8GM72_9CHLR|nr:hypothetical protein [Bellilinea caldifistulae]KPL74490.1 hypothetical protein AC812_11835 [Bellilinea caldifistulae]GAP11691.1 hypothetical protein BECAL_02882 [Bellilinea caldifistulae]
MNVEIFAEWLRRQGHHIYQTASSYWYDAGPRVLQSFPYHWLIQPSSREIQDLLWKKNILAVRFSAPVNSPTGMISYHVVLEDPEYCLEKLKPQARNGIRRGLENCRIEQISFERLADEGWQLQRDTLERQNRLNSMKKEQWQRICLAAIGLPSLTTWAALVSSELAAAIITCRLADKVYVPYALSRSTFLGLHVNQALFYTACREIMSEPGITGIFFNLHSLDAPESVDEFKFRLGFTAKPVRQQIIFHPLVKPLINKTTYRIIVSRIEKDPQNTFLRKVEGMMRFFLRGKQPLADQPWPKCLENAREEWQPIQ